MIEEIIEFTPIKQIPKLVEEAEKDFSSGFTKDVRFRKEQLKQLVKFAKETKDLVRE